MNESDPENRMTKKILKELKVITYTNKMHFHFHWSDHKNTKIKYALSGTILC